MLVIMPQFALKLRFLSTLYFFNDTATTEIYTLSLHDALPISCVDHAVARFPKLLAPEGLVVPFVDDQDRKSTRLNSSHQIISYAVFCLKKKINRFPLPTVAARNM